MSVLESFAHSKPVIGSRAGGIPEQTTPECGMTLEPGNVEELAHKMRPLLEDRDLRLQMGRAARARAVECFGAQKHRDALLELFGRPIGGEAEAKAAPAV